MEDRQSVQGTNAGAKAADRQPKVVAAMPGDEKLKDPKEAAAHDGYPGSCQI